MSLNKIVHMIRKEQKCSRQHAYRLAHKLLEGMEELDREEQANDRKFRGIIEWDDKLQVKALFEY